MNACQAGAVVHDAGEILHSDCQAFEGAEIGGVSVQWAVVVLSRVEVCITHGPKRSFCKEWGVHKVQGYIGMLT